MEENLSALRAELAALEEEEARLSAERRHLHRQIDFGFASETTRAREREVSDRRRDLHGRIDAIRSADRLSTQLGDLQKPSGGARQYHQFFSGVQPCAC
jgi:chromosome segregation ATPase